MGSQKIICRMCDYSSKVEKEFVTTPERVVLCRRCWDTYEEIVSEDADKKVDLTVEYQQAVLDWKKHCQTKMHSSNPNDFVNCHAFKKIVAMGVTALPLIQKTMHSDTDPTFCIFGWTTLVGRIVGKKFTTPENLHGKVQAIFEFTRNWLDKELKKN